MGLKRGKNKLGILLLVSSFLLVSNGGTQLAQANSGIDMLSNSVSLAKSEEEHPIDHQTARLEYFRQIRQEEKQRIHKEAILERSSFTVDVEKTQTIVFVAPDNDNMANATVVNSLPYTDSLDTSEATIEPSEPEYICGANVRKTVWYRYTPSSAGFFIVDTAGSSFDYDTVLHVFEDLGEGNLSYMSCNDDWNNTLKSKISINGEAGTTYLIGVGGWGGASGNLVINFDTIGPFTSCAAVDLPQAECEILESLYNNTGGASWHNNNGWFGTNLACTWYGIICSQENLKVEQIILWDNNLVGPLSIDFSGLSELWWLDLSGNQLTGDLSTVIGNLPISVQYLYLAQNQLNGNIPAGISNLIGLLGFSVEGNQLGGSMTTAIGYLPPAIIYLYLNENQFTGTIPAEISDLINLSSLDLSGNLMVGDMTTIIGYLPFSISYLNLGSNGFTGTIPTETSNLLKLKSLDLSGNDLYGDMAAMITNLPSGMQHLYLDDNQFTGTIPAEISSFSGLEGFGAGGNQLVGDMLTIIGNLPSALSYLSLNDNQFTGTLSSEISSLPDLWSLDLSGNLLTGNMSTIIDNLPNGMEYLYLGLNEFDGTIPASISNLVNLWSLDLSSNQLTGDLATIIANLPSGLGELYINHNQFSGSIPSTISAITLLNEFDLSYNPDTGGTIPLEITGLSLDHFNFEQTYICEPVDPSYDTWKASVTEYTPGLCAPIVAVSPSGTISEIAPTFEWEEGGDASQYQLLVDDTGGEIFSSWYDPSVICSSGTCSITPSLSLTVGDYEWTVRGMYGGLEGPWTTPVDFTVALPSEALTNTSFEINVPAYWREGDYLEPSDGPDCGAGNANTGDCALVLHGNGSFKRVFSLNPYTASAGVEFTLSLSRKGADVPSEAHTYANIILFYTDGTREAFNLWLHQGDLSVWEQRSITVTAAKDVKRYNLNIFYKKASGTMWVDDISVTHNGGANLVTDPSFESWKPDEWMLSENFTPDDGPACAPAEAYSGSCSLRFVGDGTIKRLLMRVREAGSAGDVINFSIFRKGDALPVGAAYANILIVHTDGTLDHNILWLHPGDSSVWEQRLLEITAEKDYKWINLNLFYKKDTGTIWLDDISLLML